MDRIFKHLLSIFGLTAVLFSGLSAQDAVSDAVSDAISDTAPVSFEMTREICLDLVPGENNPRNSEGDFIRTKDGRILFVYSQYFGKSASDHAHANLAAIWSSDEGKTWSEPEIIVKMDGGLNVMSVSLIRLQDGRIGLFYLRKYSMSDNREWVRYSTDEGKTWSEAECCISDEFKDYYVVNNARIIQLRDGTILVPACHHKTIHGKFDWSGELVCFYSKDAGKTFQRGEYVKKPKGLVFQEPGVNELEDGTIFMYTRTTSGSQFVMRSKDGGITWDEPGPSQFTSPCSPLLIRPIPGTKRFLAVWNDTPKGRNPLNIAVLDAELNILWKTVLDKSEGTPPQWFCYPAILALNEKEFLISYCAGVMPGVGLEKTRIVKVRLEEK